MAHSKAVKTIQLVSAKGTNQLHDEQSTFDVNSHLKGKTPCVIKDTHDAHQIRRVPHYSTNEDLGLGLRTLLAARVSMQPLPCEQL